MAPSVKAGNARRRHSWQQAAEMDAGNSDIGLPTAKAVAMRGKRFPATVSADFATRSKNVSPISKRAASAPAAGPAHLSIRAENVLKELASELTGENPPKGRWIPSAELLRKLTFGRLLTARNCGPQTIDEIVRWAQMCGVVIQPPLHAGKPLSTMWRDLIAKFSAGEFTKAEIAEALERSARRRNTRIPVAFQNMLTKILSSPCE
jgi:hypothetical protein